MHPRADFIRIRSLVRETRSRLDELEDTVLGLARHSKDFRSVRWFGSNFAFTDQQARAIQLLWEAWEEGTPDISMRGVMDQLGAGDNDLRDLFRNHPAWGTMIEQKGPKGTARLVESDISED